MRYRAAEAVARACATGSDTRAPAGPPRSEQQLPGGRQHRPAAGAGQLARAPRPRRRDRGARGTRTVTTVPRRGHRRPGARPDGRTGPRARSRAGPAARPHGRPARRAGRRRGPRRAAAACRRRPSRRCPTATCSSRPCDERHPVHLDRERARAGAAARPAPRRSGTRAGRAGPSDEAARSAPSAPTPRCRALTTTPPASSTSRSIGRGVPSRTRSAAAAGSSTGSPTVRARSLPVPKREQPDRTVQLGRGRAGRATAWCRLPSPPATTRVAPPRSSSAADRVSASDDLATPSRPRGRPRTATAASRASAEALPAPGLARTRYRTVMPRRSFPLP